MRIVRQLRRLKTPGGESLLLVIALAASAALAGCPLPFEYNGAGATNAHTSDPSSPNMTSSVTVSYSVQGGPSGTIADGDSFVSGQTTTVTLSTASLNAVIFYTDNGTSLTDLRSANKISATSGAFTITRTTSLQSMDIRAVAVGPNMLPSPAVHATVAVSPFPILSVTRSAASISEDGGTATFTISASSPPASDITVSLLTGGTYTAADVTGIPVSGTTFTATLAQSATTATVSITGVHNAVSADHTVVLTIQPDPANPQTYSIGAPSSASLTIQDDLVPVLAISASPSTIPDNGGVTVFTVTSSLVLASDLTVHLQTGGAYEPGDLTGMPAIPAQGSSFTLTLPTGQTSVTQSVTAHPDAGEYLNQTVTVSLVPDPRYTIGAPNAATVAVTDTSPIPVLTLTEDRTSMLDGQSATFTVTANVAPDADQTVNISSSGYTPGQVTIPASVTLPVGATSATFQVSAPSQAGYLVQNPLVSLIAGVGHSIGSPGAQSLLITDDVVGVTYDGVWSFNTDTGSTVGTGASWTLTGNVTLGSGGLSFGGVYPSDDATVPLSAGGVVFNNSAFTIAVKFSMSNLSSSRPIVVGGTSYRWFMAEADTAGNLKVELNNHTVHLPLGMSIAAGTTYTLVLDFDVASLTLTAWLNGAMVVVPLPPGFAWVYPPTDERLSANDFSTGRAFMGTWEWVFAVNGLLSYDTIIAMAAGSGL